MAVSNVRLPPYPVGSRPSTAVLLKGIFEFDQFDDWLPDPAYYEDQRLNEQKVTQRIERLWQSQELPPRGVEVLNLPRNSGGRIPGLTLSLDERICAHGVIAAMAPRIIPALLKDKVYGFEYRKDQAPLFSQPGDGLPKLFENLLVAIEYGMSNRFQILDVVGFNQNASFDRLTSILQTFGARPDEASFLRNLVQASNSGIPSIDDAFAFLYNFYLQPVDRALANAKNNFFRYRDEYFVLDNRAKQRVQTQLVEIGLRSRLVAQSGNLDVKSKLVERVWSKLKKNPTGGDSEAEERLGKLYGGELKARYSCDSWDESEKRCITESYELVYEKVDVNAVQELFKLPCKTAPLDSIQILPLLRAIHKQRRSGVVLRPPFNRATNEFAGYRKRLATGRNWLQDALATALRTSTDWQMTWVLPLLSDLGPLQKLEIEMMQQVIGRVNVGATAKIQARMALARSSDLPIERFWQGPSAMKTQYMIRSSLLAARYLFNRNHGRAWMISEQSARDSESELINFLTTNME